MAEPFVRVLQVPNFPSFGKAFAARREKFYKKAMAAVVLDIIEGINRQEDATGGQFPALEPETIKRKGHANALIDKGLLRDRYTYEELSHWRNDWAEVYVKPLARTIKTRNGSRQDTPRDQVAKALQIDGIDTKSGRKYFRFFGITKNAEAQIMEMIDLVVQESLEAI